jgi:hypothetical protein
MLPAEVEQVKTIAREPPKLPEIKKKRNLEQESTLAKYIALVGYFHAREIHKPFSSIICPRECLKVTNVVFGLVIAACS